MGLSIIRYQDPKEGTAAQGGDQAAGNGERWGVLEGDIVYPLPLSLVVTADLLRAGAASLREQCDRDKGLAYDSLQILSPVTTPAKLICLGVNYAPHRAEAGLKTTRPAQMLMFGKDSSSVTGPFHDVIRPENVELLDYEIELGLVLGRDITGAETFRQGSLFPTVAAMVICNDISARCDQFGQAFMQWFQGKSYRTFSPMGPVLYVLEDGDEDLIYNLSLTLTVNGDVRQQAQTAELVFSPAEALTRISAVVDMAAGDVILTGTPGGVALKLEEADRANLRDNLFQDTARRSILLDSQRGKEAFLRPGDVVTARIASTDGSLSLGEQRNKIVEP